VSRKEELVSAVETARKYDSKVLIEEAVVGSEIGCAILGNGTDLIAGEVDHIELSHGFFRIHQEDRPETGSDNSERSSPPTSRRSRDRSSWRRRRPSIALWDAGDWRGWTCSSRGTVP
jgi:hypothetical protein